MDNNLVMFKTTNLILQTSTYSNDFQMAEWKVLRRHVTDMGTTTMLTPNNTMKPPTAFPAQEKSPESGKVGQ